MYHTPPPKMVLTRSGSKTLAAANVNTEMINEAHPSGSVKSEPAKLQVPPPCPPFCLLEPQPLSKPPITEQAGSSQLMKKLEFPPHDAPRDRKSRASISSSAKAKRKRLELEAAQEKARIQMELIDKRLEADLADLDDEYSPPGGSRESIQTRTDVEKWLEHSQHEMDKEPLAPQNGNTQGELIPQNGPIEMLTSALKQLATAPIHGPNPQLLSRMSIPKDLPEFAGDPLEWLHFKQAYTESTQICGFSDKENIWRLRKCLRGPAKEAVSALLICASSPDQLMSALELQFGNPDFILSKITQDLQKVHPLPPDYQCEIVPFAIKIQNYVTAVRAVGRDEYLRGFHLSNIILAKLPTVLISKWADYSYPRLQDGSNKSRIDMISDFLHEEAQKISTTANVNIFPSSCYQNKYKSKQPHTVLVQYPENRDAETKEKCKYCNKSEHALTKCKQFLKALRKDRWRHVKRYGLCFKCLLSRHGRETCSAPACDRDNCGGAHHKLLHNPPRRELNETTTEEKKPSTSTASASETVAHLSVTDKKVLLKVVPVNVHGPNGVISACALLDDGSTVSLISSQLAARAGLNGRAESLRVRGAWGDDALVCASTALTLDLSAKGSNNELLTINVRSVNNLDLPVQNVSLTECQQYAHLSNVKINCSDLCKPEILLGQDNYHLLMPLEICVGKNNEPSATRTPLGWCVHGILHVPRAAPSSPYTTLFITETASADDRALQALSEEVRRSFSIDVLGVSGKPRQNKDEVRAVDLLENSAQLIDGRWHVGLPWKEPKCKLPDSYPYALSRLHNVERKMSASQEYASKYKERVNHLLENDFAKELENTEKSPRTWYLPHFGVNNPNKKKLRLVFDAAAKVHGESLNDYLLTGPDLLNSLFGIMLRFRINKVGVTGDIKDMFLRIKIKSEDQNALRFLWRDHTAGEIKTYAMTSLIFGANCSPFIAQFIKNKNAQQHESSQPAAVAAIYRQHYMDDYIDSLPDETTAIDMVRNIIDIHKQGGFEIRNWTSNSLPVLDSVPKETLGDAAVRFKIDGQFQGERTLGMIWYPGQDELSFDVTLKRIPDSIIKGKQRPTKRLMLAVIMSIFDIFGFLSPFTIQGKIMLQDIWKYNIDWDETIPDDVYKKWCNWIDLLKEIPNIRIPRYYVAAGASETEIVSTTSVRETDSAASTQLLRETTTHPSHDYVTGRATRYATSLATSPATASRPYNNLQLHVFCDASSKAMCAVAYWRWEDDGNVYVAFIASKSRVAPLKPITIPKLELQAALLAARLADTITREHELKINERYFWCDSTTVLQWIYNDTRHYKTFVANRLGEIDDLTRASEWRYVPTKLNIADIGTRETYDVTVFNNDWFVGPSFLHHDKSTWPRHDCMPATSDADLEKINMISLEPVNLPLLDASRFSSWLRLLRVTATVLRFINKCRKITSVSTLMEMEQAERLLIKQAQMDSFAAEISEIKKEKSIDRNSRLLTLSPFLDEHNVLRCGGRIDATTGVPPETKHPVILDGKHHIARLIVKHHHEKAAHGNQETIVNNLKQRYWLIKLRPTVKYVAARCMLCRIRKAKPEIPRMGDLPAARMDHHQRPFTHCGIDLFGPMTVTVGRRQEKRYGVIFTCLTVRAVHLEIVHSVSTDSMIMALRRMAARRGWPRHLMSDNGTNLRGADTELKRSVKELDEEVLRIEAANHATEWSFIPPVSPHWGGAWERLIRSIKTSLKVILKERAPKDEVLCTLLAEVENIVNSRPLSHVSVEPGSDETLTPNHFLLGSSSNLPIPGRFDDSDLSLRKQWRKSQKLADMFWKRWVNEILPELVPRRKWNHEQRSLQVGDLVLIVDPGAPRNVWPKAVVQQVFPGADGRVRMVEVRTKSGTLKRSAARVARIPLVDEC
ncbi:hypothetical protein ABMA27_003188 [Loxostege sticticalis]|uniref:Integrase catalytic domain-containing protein n=1 Tax=Loxostege sticticalis TaxID=481309 RepID=A0ABR3HSB7_LOXSC